MAEPGSTETIRPAARNVGPLAEGTMTVRVNYRDTDQMGFVYYANYLVYFEMARTNLLRSLGRSYRECEEAGIFLPALHASCDYLAPAYYDDLLEIETRVTNWTRAAIAFEYVCRRKGEDVALATGVAEPVAVHADDAVGVERAQRTRQVEIEPACPQARRQGHRRGRD